MDAKQPRGVPTGNRDAEFADQVQLFGAVVWQGVRLAGARVSRIGGRRCVDGIGVQPPLECERSREGNSARDRSVGLQQQAIESPVVGGVEGTVGFIGGTSSPAVAAPPVLNDAMVTPGSTRKSITS